MADLNISGDIQISPTSLTGSLHPTTINLSGDLDTGNGKDGYSPTVDVEAITGGHRITITDRDGAHTFDVVDGTVGVGISDISKTSTHDAEDTYTITYTDGSTTTFVVTNGEVTWNDVGNIAVVSHTQPSSSHNVIWIEDEGTTIELPTMDDLEEVADDVSDLKADINQLQTDLGKVYTGSEIHYSSINKLNPQEVETGKGLYSDGTVIDKDGRVVTGYIPLSTDKTSIVLSGLNSAGTARIGLPTNRFCFYGSSKAYVSKTDDVPSNTVTTIPDGAAYARIEYTTEYNTQRSPMVEFVDALSEISSTFVQYADVVISTHGINYLNETVDALVPQVEENTENIEAIIGYKKTIDNLTTFERGGAGSTGQYDTYYQYRVATPNIYTTTNTITITIADGFRVYLNYFSSGTRVSGGWIPSGTVIPSGSEIRLMIARTTEDTSEIADVEFFCSKVLYGSKGGFEDLSEQVDVLNMLNGRTDGMTWDWWITCNSIDDFGNTYIGYVDTDGYAGIIRRQPDGVTQYKRLEKLRNDDDHNAPATIVLDDGKILLIGSYGHTENNHIVCWRSTTAYSIDDMEKLSFDIVGSGYTYRTCYSQIFKYNGVLFDFLRFGSEPTGGSATYGYACLISSNNGATWTPYKVFNGTDAYNAIAQCTDDDKYLKVVVAKNPSSGNSTFKGCYIDLSTYKIYDLSDTQIGTMVALNGGSIVDASCAQESDMTSIITQTTSTQKGRLFFTANAELADTIFLYAIATDSTDEDFTYKVYKNGTVTDIGNSGIGFGNVHYISGACFGADENTVYYSKATTEKADGNHELHKVKISSGSVASDNIITEASMCILRPLFLGNGELATVVGHYNDQNSDGTYNGSFTAWELKPLFTHA